MGQAAFWTHARTCPGKVAYATKDAARREAKHLRARGRNVEAYRCSHCAAFHLGSARVKP